MTTSYTRVEIPRQGVNDDSVQIVEWLVADGAKVDEGQPLLVVETTKSTVDVDATASGFVFHLTEVGVDVPVGAAVAVINPTDERPADLAPNAQAGAPATGTSAPATCCTTAGSSPASTASASGPPSTTTA